MENSNPLVLLSSSSQQLHHAALTQQPSPSLQGRVGTFRMGRSDLVIKEHFLPKANISAKENAVSPLKTWIIIEVNDCRTPAGQGEPPRTSLHLGSDARMRCSGVGLHFRDEATRAG